MKTLVSPLFVLFLLLAAALLLAHWRFKRHPHAWFTRLWLYSGLFFTILLYFSATPAGSEALRGTLYPLLAEEADSGNTEVEWIVVLSGGYAIGTMPGETVLTTETALRTAHGIFLAKKFPKACLIFSGAGYGARLMRELAISRGIDPQRCVIEPKALNTRMHPPSVLALDGVEADDLILVVSSDWHLPRAKPEFEKLFTNVSYSASSRRTRAGPLWEKWFPSESAFSASALYIREWVGRFYYALLR